MEKYLLISIFMMGGVLSSMEQEKSEKSSIPSLHFSKSEKGKIEAKAYQKLIDHYVNGASRKTLFPGLKPKLGDKKRFDISDADPVVACYYLAKRNIEVRFLERLSFWRNWYELNPKTRVIIVAGGKVEDFLRWLKKIDDELWRSKFGHEKYNQICLMADATSDLFLKSAVDHKKIFLKKFEQLKQTCVEKNVEDPELLERVFSRIEEQIKEMTFTIEMFGPVSEKKEIIGDEGFAIEELKKIKDTASSAIVQNYFDGVAWETLFPGYRESKNPAFFLASLIRYKLEICFLNEFPLFWSDWYTLNPATRKQSLTMSAHTMVHLAEKAMIKKMGLLMGRKKSQQIVEASGELCTRFLTRVPFTEKAFYKDIFLLKFNRLKEYYEKNGLNKCSEYYSLLSTIEFATFKLSYRTSSVQLII